MDVLTDSLIWGEDLLLHIALHLLLLHLRLRQIHVRSPFVNV